MSDNEKKLNWKRPLTILGILAILTIIGIFVFAPSEPSGCFRFNDGSTQNWTLDQLYDSNSDPYVKVTTIIPGTPPTYQTYTPFKLANHQNIALEASTNLFLVSDKNVTSTDIYFESPDLTTDPNWQNIVGYKLDVRREFTGKCGDPPKSFYAQLQFKIIDKSNKERTISELDNTGNFKFYEIKLNTPYLLKWEWGNPLKLGTETLNFNDYKVKNLRIRFTMPGFISNGECWYQGKWKIGNVCPIK